MKIQTNHHRRPVINGWEVPPSVRQEFDYINWEGIDNGTDSASFVQYQGQWHDLGEFSRIIAPDARRLHPMDCAEPAFQKWHGYRSDSYFFGMLIRYVDDYEQVIVATYTT